MCQGFRNVFMLVSYDFEKKKKKKKKKEYHEKVFSIFSFSYSISSCQSTLHLICFDTALREQPPLSVMTLCDLPSLWRVSMIDFWTIAKSAVFPIIVVSMNKRDPEFILKKNWTVAQWSKVLFSDESKFSI